MPPEGVRLTARPDRPTSHSSVLLRQVRPLRGSAAGDVPDRPDLLSRTAVFIDLHLPAVAQFPCLLEPQILGARNTSGGEDDDVGRDLGAVVEVKDAVPACMPAAEGVDSEADVDPGFRQVFAGQFTGPGFFTFQEPVPAVDQGDIDSETGQEGGRLNPDGTPADDHSPLREGRGRIDFPVSPGRDLIQPSRAGMTGSEPVAIIM